MSINGDSEAPKQLLSMLQDLIRIHSPSGSEHEIASYLQRFLVSEGWHADCDAHYNVSAYPADKQHVALPLLNAHMDTFPNRDENPEKRVATPEELQKIILRLGVEGRVIKTDEAGNDYENNIQVGFDDKIGIAMILWLVKYRKDLSFKILLTTVEEEKQKGVRHFLDNSNGFFKGVSWGMTLDRKEDTDIVWMYGKEGGEKQYGRELGQQCICSGAFAEALETISKTLGTPMMREKSLNWSDAYHIHCRGECRNIVNLSVGYSNMHKVHDALNMDAAMKVLNLVQECLGEERAKQLAEIPCKQLKVNG